jgi:hypothetical protein
VGTWQVPQACLPDADKLVSKNIALPAAAAVLWVTGGGGEPV